jgi:hypothetical protein
VADLGELVAERYRLGEATAPLFPVAGGFLNRMWRLDATDGSFAVKELNLGRDWPCDFDAVFALELAALAAGVAMPEPLADPLSGRPVVAFEEPRTSVVVHRWVEGVPVPADPVADVFAFAVGREISRVHRLDVSWPEAAGRVPMPDERAWRGLAAQASRAAMPWAGRLADGAVDLARIGKLVEAWHDRASDVRVSHRDVGWKNLLDQSGRPILVDWEGAGPVAVSSELGHAGVGLAAGGAIADFDAEVFAAFVAGYAAGGGVLPSPGPHWLSMLFSNWTHFVRWNILRCLTNAVGTEPEDGPGLAVAHRVVEGGLTELRRALDQLGSLTEAIADAVARV